MKKYTKKLYSILITIVLIFGLSNIQYSYATSKNSSGSYNIVINCKNNKLGYFKDGKLVKEFRVATGKSSTPTPKGKFKIVNRIKNRPYYSGGIPGGSPNNPLGDRWLGLQVGATYGTTYGIHGNNNESSIGKYVSGGCIRMHNKEVRWLFDQVPVGTTVIIYNSNDSFVDAAKKYGIDLTDNKELNSNQKDVKDKFKNFTTYGSQSNPTINLKDTNSLISTFAQTEDILRTYSSDGKATDRQLFINSWNKLTSEEKKHKEMDDIWKEYEKIIAVVEAAQASNKFYEDVKNNANTLLFDYNTSKNLNSLSNLNLGARGKAKQEYDEATKYGEQSTNSKRMKDIYDKYTDVSNFLEVLSHLESRNYDKAIDVSRKINDADLKNIISQGLESYSDIVGHWAEANIKSAMDKRWVAKSNIFRPSNSITRAEFVTIVNNAFGFTQKSDISFKDIKNSDWFYGQVSVAVAAGYINGYEDNTFKPNEFITRQEAASIITSIKGNKDSNLDKLSTYSDSSEVSEWAKSSVEGCIEAGYMGAGSKIFNPKSNITRAETIVTVERVLN